MNHLFIEFYLDEDVSTLVAQLVRGRGFAVTTTQEAGQGGRSDGEQLSYAVSRRTTLVTHNRADFELLARQYFNAGLKHLRNNHRSAAPGARNRTPPVDNSGSGNSGRD